MPVNVMVTLRKALHQLEGERARIDSQIAAIRGVLGAATDSKGRSGASTPARSPRRRRRRMSAAARRAASQRMKAYWAKRRTAKAKSRKTK